MTRLNLLNKISSGQIDIDVNSYLQPQSEVRTRGSHRYMYRQDKATKNIYFYSFFSRTIRLWNKLPAEIVESNALAVFYSKLLEVSYFYNFCSILIHLFFIYMYYLVYLLILSEHCLYFIIVSFNSWCDICNGFYQLNKIQPGYRNCHFRDTNHSK